MRPDVLERLLWERHEGTISAADRGRLEAQLAEDAGAERRSREVLALAEMLAGVEDVAVPPVLHQRIERAVAGRRQVAPRQSWTAALRDLVAPRWRVRVAWATVGVVVGVAATVLVVSDFRGVTDADVSKYYGAAGRPAGAVTAAGRIELPGTIGTLMLAGDGATLVAELEVVHPPAEPVALELAGRGLRVESVRAAGGVASALESGQDVVTASLSGGGRLSVRLAVADSAAAVTVAVSAGGERLLSRELTLASLGAR